MGLQGILFPSVGFQITLNLEFRKRGGGINTVNLAQNFKDFCQVCSQLLLSVSTLKHTGT